MLHLAGIERRQSSWLRFFEPRFEPRSVWIRYEGTAGSQLRIDRTNSGRVVKKKMANKEEDKSYK